MLRASCDAFQYPLDLRGIVDDRLDVGVPGGAELVAFASAVVDGDADGLNGARDSLSEAVGTAGTVEAAGVAANFQMMNRILDGVGLPPAPRFAAIAPELGIAPTV